ncbi:hypothetical protein Daus18300_010432 [Diaporthe australafricana]|uniref:Peptidase S8/S53 domain-containing protein n=1 Tax=Diaporthe australafricana TaxID=127596 RepID=A0ABR3WAJ7_9PEZI
MHADGCNLDLFLSLSRSPWQEVRISVHEEASIKFLINDKVVAKSTGNEKQIKNLCKLMTQSRKKRLHSHRLNFIVKDGKLWNTTPQPNIFSMNLSGDEISLEDFIGTQANALTEMTKRIIAVMLGHSVLHLHGTGWIQQSWGASNVVFYKLSSAIPIQPFIRVDLTEGVPSGDGGDDDGSDDEDYFGNDDFFMHPFPSLVALGMMLMQVYMARTFESFVQEFDKDDLEQLDNNDKFTLASEAFAKHKSVILFSEQYRNAIDKCLDPNIQFDEDGEMMDEDGLRRVIYNDIVGPLEDELGQGKFAVPDFILNLDTEARNIDLANWGRPLKFEAPSRLDEGVHTLPKRPKPTTRSVKTTTNQESHPPSPLDRCGKFVRAGHRERMHNCIPKQMWLCKPAASDFFDDESRQEDIKQQACDEFVSWKTDLLEVYDEFLVSAPRPQPTKIAVLDTGLDLEHPDFIYNPERRQRIKDQKNFTRNKREAAYSNQGPFDDESGHGTHIAGLLLDMAPDSDLYIAKIAENNPSTNQFIAEAIMHAVDTWEVDIISMSFGFTTRQTQGYDLIEKALEHANSKNILLFAAASNSGANQRRTFPARHDYVICVHSTAADGMPSRFNAPCEVGDNFATIGETVESSWPTRLCNKEANEAFIAWKSGTSFATPIAVGIATFFLQYAKENMGHDALRLLKRPHGMRAVFREISFKKNGYDYIAPKIHHDHLFGQSKEYVKERISLVLNGS